MSATMNDRWIEVATRVAEVWEARRTVEMRCRTTLTSTTEPEPARFGYLSMASNVEQLVTAGSVISDTETGARIDQHALEARLVGGEIVAFVSDATTMTGRAAVELSLDSDLGLARQRVRRDVSEMQFLLRQFALDEIGSRRGASRDLVTTIQRRWNDQMAVLMDLAMVLSLGADRQRYTDAHYVARFNLRVPVGYRRLIQLGVRSNPLLVLD